MALVKPFSDKLNTLSAFKNIAKIKESNGNMNGKAVFSKISTHVLSPLAVISYPTALKSYNSIMLGTFVLILTLLMKGMSTQHRGWAVGQLRAGPQLCHDLHLRRRHGPDQAWQTARDHALVICYCCFRLVDFYSL